MSKTSPRLIGVGLGSFALAAILGFYVSGIFIPHRSNGNLTYVHKDDPELQNAIETAQRGLPEFKKELLNPPKDIKLFAIKGRFPTAESTKSARPGYEYLYVDHLKLVGDDFEGILHDEPLVATEFHKGDTVKVKQSDVVDWLIVHQDNLQEGGLTDELLRKRQGQ